MLGIISKANNYLRENSICEKCSRKRPWPKTKVTNVHALLWVGPSHKGAIAYVARQEQFSAVYEMRGRIG